MKKLSKSKNKLNRRIRIVIGDWSCDGHEKTEVTMIRSNLTKEKILAAYKKGVEKVGLDLSKDVARDYQDWNCRLKDWKKLELAGFPFSDWFGEDELEMFNSGEEEMSLSTELFLEMYFFLVKQGSSAFEYEIVEEKDGSLHIGGYGLFY